MVDLTKTQLNDYTYKNNLDIQENLKFISQYIEKYYYEKYMYCIILDEYDNINLINFPLIDI